MSEDFMEPWHDFFVAEASAVAALAGLLFVAVSINLTRVLEFRHLPTRAIESLTAFLSVLAVASIALTPNQVAIAVGLELCAAGALTWALQTAALIRTRAETRAYPRFGLRVAANQLPALPFAFAGAMIALGHPWGAYALLPGTLLSIAAGTFGAWVLLVEIQR